MSSKSETESTDKTTRNTDTEKSNDRSENESEKEQFGNSFEFVLTCLGLAVGLGNIWRFPTRAFNNGGAAFLIPYVTIAVIFGLPAVYLEFLAGQYARTAPPIVMHRVMPFLEGVGWMGSVVAGSVAVYYIIIISWICIYLVNTFRGHIALWTLCDNDWNDPETCINTELQKNCMNSSFLYTQGKCVPVESIGKTLQTATEQYFYNNIVRPSNGFYDINSLNLPIFISMTCCWLLVVLITWRGMKFMGKLSYVTVLLPYIIIVILFFRAVTLEGAGSGIYYYLGNPDFSKLISIKTWSEALKQMCFSISIGHGGLMNMASFNKKRNNCFRDAALVIAGDTLMSLVGGAAVFATMGFLATLRGIEVPDVVSSGLAIAFSIYPEAVSKMPGAPFWSFLFFMMLFLLSLSTEIALVEVFASCAASRFPLLRKHRQLVIIGWSAFLYIVGIMMTTDAGIYWFEMFDDYAGFSSIIATLMNILVLVYIYGAENLIDDAKKILGKPKNQFTAIFGPTSRYYVFNWRFITPIIGAILMVLSVIREYPFQGDANKYPRGFDVGGWIIQILPFMLVPLFMWINYNQFVSKKWSIKGLFMLQKSHPSYERIAANMNEDKKSLQKILPTEELWGKKSKSNSESESGSTE